MKDSSSEKKIVEMRKKSVANAICDKIICVILNYTNINHCHWILLRDIIKTHRAIHTTVIVTTNTHTPRVQIKFLYNFTFLAECKVAGWLSHVSRCCMRRQQTHTEPKKFDFDLIKLSKRIFIWQSYSLYQKAAIWRSTRHRHHHEMWKASYIYKLLSAWNLEQNGVLFARRICLQQFYFRFSIFTAPKTI